MRPVYPHLRNVLFLLLFLSGMQLSAQQAEFNYGNRWRFGLNVGGMWQASDMTNYAGAGWGFTIEKGLTKSKTAPLYFDLRYRFLAGNTYGIDTRVNKALADNDALNGKNDTVSNYLLSPGYFFNNYKSRVFSNDLELKVGFNQLLQRARIHLYLWGGVGVTRYNTTIDALDANGSKYTFMGVDTTGGKASVSALTSVFDDKYETNAHGNSGSGVVRFSPSFGVGFGYKFSNHFSLILEHKVTFPGSDLMDGEQYFRKKNSFGLKNDYYHYSAAKLLFTFGRAKSNNSTYTNHNNYTATNNPPEIRIISPSSNPYTSPANNVQVYANVKFVTASSGIGITVNGTPMTTFTFTPSSGALSFATPLQAGSNAIVITASNNYGTDTESLTVNYGGLPPVVTIYSPTNNSTLQTPTTNISANVKNVTRMDQISVNVNGTLLTNYSFNTANGDVSFTMNLNNGTNVIGITGTNQFGTDTKSVTVYYTPAVLAKPMVTITNPPAPNHQVSNPAFTMTANVVNVTSSSQLTVLVNGVQTTAFNFNSSNGSLTVPTSLNAGTTSFVVTATNSAGSDTKQTSVVYSGNPPVVTFTAPSATPFTSTTSTYNVQAKVTGVSSRQDIKFYVNNVLENGFNYNTATQTLDYNMALSTPVYVVTIVATNNWGVDTKSTTIEFRAPASPKPVVIISNPPAAPHTSATPNFTVVATVNNVTTKSQISVKVNGATVSNFTYNLLTKQLTIPATLVAGVATPVTITATNSSGSDSKSTSLLYAPKPVVTFINPSADPSTFSSVSVPVTAEVKNVTQQSQVSVMVNGAPVNFNWNAANSQATFTAAINPGNNAVTVTGTNVSGSDSKTTTLIFQDLPRGARPVVTITSPSASGTTVNSPTYLFTATVNNVNAANQVTATLNGAAVSASFSNGTVTYNASLISGNNTFAVSATNSFGSDQASTSISYVLPAAAKAPKVTIVNPAAAGTTVQTSTYQFQATVLNVTSASQVSAMFNGATVAAQYANGTVSYNAALLSGNNTFSVTANNGAGSHSASTSVNYVTPQGTPPVVTITAPAVPGTSVSGSTFQFSASVTNVNAAAQVTALFNGAPVNAQYGHGVVTYTGNLLNGTNTFSVTAANTFGSHSAATSVVKSSNPPVVTITNPASTGSTVNNSTYQFVANVTNVTSANQVTVTLNGSAVNAQVSGGNVTYQATLNSGNNVFAVSASNADGSDSKSTTINYVNLVNPPVITFLAPMSAGEISTTAAYFYKATITNISNSGQLTVKYNGQQTSGFNFMPSSKSFSYTGTLQNGNNTLEITASNTSGSDYKSTYVIYQTSFPLDSMRSGGGNTGGGTNGGNTGGNTGGGTTGGNTGGGTTGGNIGGTKTGVIGSDADPKITICHYPPGNTSNPQVIQIPQSAWAAHQAHGDVLGGTCPPQTNGNGSNGNGNGNGNNSNSNSNNGGNSNTNSDPNITICHYPPGNTSNPQVIQIPQSAWAAHQAHGDVLGGTCPPQTNGNGSNGNGNGNNSNSNSNNGGNSNTNSDPNITICHYPPGNTSNPQVIQIPQSAWAAHQAHGDVLGGTCPQTNGNGNNSNSNSNNGGNSSTNSDPNITICHYPPGNTGNPQVIQIPQSAWAAHQAHGDVLGGTCPQTNGNGTNGNGNSGSNSGNTSNSNSGNSNSGSNGNSGGNGNNSGNNSNSGGGGKGGNGNGNGGRILNGVINAVQNSSNGGNSGNNNGNGGKQNTNTNTNSNTNKNTNSGTNTSNNSSNNSTNKPADEKKTETPLIKPATNTVTPKVNTGGGTPVVKPGGGKGG